MELWRKLRREGNTIVRYEGKPEREERGRKVRRENAVWEEKI